MKDLFRFIMEAEGDELEAFSPDPEESTVPEQQENPPAGGQDLDGPPPMSETDDSVEGMSEDDMLVGDNSSGEEQPEEGDQKEDDTLSEKANNILNQKLYQQMVDRNNEISGILESLDKLNPVLPFDIIKANDKFIGDLKTALERGRHYVINDFVDTGYGENLLFFNKLNSLYIILLNSIDSNLKKVDTKD